MRRIMLIAAALLAACQGEQVAEPTRAEAFSFTAAVEPQGPTALQRIEVPAAALAAIRREDLGDIRVFDGRGKVLPLARLAPDGQDAQQGHAVPAYPVAGTAAAPGGAAVSIEIAQPGQTVSVETGGAAGSDTAAVLIDTRALEDPAVALALDTDLPAQVPVTFTLEASGDLKAWEPLGDKVLFSPGAGQAPLGGARIALPGANLHQRYLRLSWKALPGLAVHGAEVFTAKAAPPARVTLATRGAKLADDYNLRFAAPIATPLAAIAVTSGTGDGVVPLRLYGRDVDEAPWAPLSAATMRSGARPAVFDVPGATYKHYRIEADPRGAGFSEAPRIELQLEPLTLLAAFNGRPPYRLAAGNPRAEPGFFAPQDLAESKIEVGKLPTASVTAAPPPAIALAPGADEGSFAPRKLVLWGALLLGTAVLAFGAIRLLRANAGSTID